MLKFSKVNFAVKYYLPLLLWMGVIFYLSSIPGNGYHGARTLWFYIERKGAHIFEYFILTLLFIRLLKFYKIRPGKVMVFSFILSLLYAFSDEFHQLFVFGREGKILDIGIDSLGIVLAALAYFLFTVKNVFPLAKKPNKKTKT